MQPVRQNASARPAAHGLYDPQYEKDSCGVAMIAHLQRQASHQIVLDGLTALERMAHRGACGCEPGSGDGAGILLAMPHAFVRRIVECELKLNRPARPGGRLAAGLVFLPPDDRRRAACQRALERSVTSRGLRSLGWRDVPRDNSTIGAAARSREPVIQQLFVQADEAMDEAVFERLLFLARLQAQRIVQRDGHDPDRCFYVVSLSSRVIVYKGQLTAHQLRQYFLDLADPAFASHLAMVHSRFSTNTFPSWERAQPMRYICHNGEINTLRGNINSFRAREGLISARGVPGFDDQLRQLAPLIDLETSDSGIFDNVLELLALAGRSLPEAIMMMIPEAWQNDPAMDVRRRAFYEFHSCLMEPWDGPASICFTDGNCAGAVLDRNGLRPSRFYVTHDERVIMSSEVGVLPIAPEQIRCKGRLQPGRMFLIDFNEGRIVDDRELKDRIAGARPYRRWLDEQRIDLADLPTLPEAPRVEPALLTQHLAAAGYTREHLEVLLRPMVLDAHEPLGSMGNDTPLAVLSDRPRLLYDYFKQLFAQVTNPPIDSIREELVMSLECYIGPEQNLLETTEAHCHRLLIRQPILTNSQLAAIQAMNHRGWRTRVIDITYPSGGISPDRPGTALIECLDRICHDAGGAIVDGYSLIVLSDRAAGPERIAVSALLAVGAVHHYLIRSARRMRVGIIVESGEPREPHHHCLLVGYGADAINPYLAFESLRRMRRDISADAKLEDVDLVARYTIATCKAIRKVMGKMGISTLQSYKGAQIFEALGLHAEVIDRCFAGTSSRISGAGFDALAEEAQRRHAAAWPARTHVGLPLLCNSGEYHWRAAGEHHMWNPQTIAELQLAARSGDTDAYWRFAHLVNEVAHRQCTLRGRLRFRDDLRPIPLNEVEPAAEIVKRFCTGAMSLGSISSETHETIAIAMNRVGAKSNTGEGGEAYDRFVPLSNGDSRRSAIKQVASGRFGVTSYYLSNADQLQIKMAQGAKPGEGGELPGHKVSLEIASTRHTTPGVTLISPPPHHDIYSIEDLAQLIFDLKNANPAARISVKLVSEVGVGTIAAGVAKAHAEHIVISGHEGGTGASPLTGIRHAGLPWELGLAETHQTLVMNDLRSRVRLETDGQLKTGRDVIIAALLGAEEFGFATAPLIALGCIMMRKCHLNTCPVGIATQDPKLRERFAGQPEHVINYFFMVAEEARRLLAQLGLRSIDEAVGRVDLLRPDDAIAHWKAPGIDLEPILAAPARPRPEVHVRCTRPQEFGLEHVLDRRLIELAQPALVADHLVRESLSISNTDRAAGAMLSNVVSARFGPKGLPEDMIHFKFSGSAGQSFGAFLAGGITLELEGDANDYVGKGLSGGKLILYPPKRATFPAEQNIIIGNVALYGATSGTAFIRGCAAERFCVRNSGATAVVEGVGDHGCEYMTGGRTVILGPVGRNFAAGMSGGIAYVWDQSNTLIRQCNLEMVQMERIDDPREMAELRALLEQHRRLTGSTVAQRLLRRWVRNVRELVKVVPTEYQRVLARPTRDARLMQEARHG